MSKKLKKLIKKVIKEQATIDREEPANFTVAPPGPLGPDPEPSNFDPGEAEKIPDKTIPVLKGDTMTTWVISSATPNTGQWISYDRSSCNRSGGTVVPKRSSIIKKNLKKRKRKPKPLTQYK